MLESCLLECQKVANEILKFSTEISSHSFLNVRFLCGQCHGIFFVVNFFTRSPKRYLYGQI